MRYIIFGITMILLTSCSKEKMTIEEDNYLVFGYFYSLHGFMDAVNQAIDVINN